MAGDGDGALAAFEDMALVDERVAVAQRDFLYEPRAENVLLQLVACDDAATLVGDREGMIPARIRWPAMRRDLRVVGTAERRAKEIARQRSKVLQDGLVVGDRRIVDPGRRVERRELSALAFDLHRAKVTGGKVDDDLDALGLDRVKAFRHARSSA